jgi:hypothetical protein
MTRDLSPVTGSPRLRLRIHARVLDVLGAASVAVLLGVFPGYAWAATATPTETPTAAPTETPAEASPTATPAFNPEATPILGGSVRVTSAADVQGVAGDVVDAGSFEIVNTTDSIESVRVIRIELSEADVFSELTLSGSEGSASVSNPSSENDFFFEPPIRILPGSSAAFALTGTIASSGSTPAARATPSPSSTATPTETPTSDFGIIGLLGGGPTKPSSPPPGGERGTAPFGLFPIGLAMTGLAAALLASFSRRRRRLIALSLVSIGIALYAGCGSDQTSEQTVTRLEVATPTRPAVMTGLPVSLGTVSRPMPLVFPGASTTPTP